jgi:hypothetical protein
MRRKLTGCFLFAAALCDAASASGSDLQITIRLFDYAGIQPGAVAVAGHTAGETLRHAGIQVRWHSCPVRGQPGTALPDCETNDAIHLVVGILPEPMPRKIATAPQQFGVAILSRTGLPVHAYVFLDRVENLAKAETAPWPQLLGTLIAHEVGHLLLGDSSHYPVGIMRACWRSEEIKLARMGSLTFTPHQARRIQDDIRRRMTSVDQERP